jgi:hypothetical protein
VTQPAADDIESSFAAFDVFDPQAVKGSIVKIEAKVGTIGILVTDASIRHRKLPGNFSVEGGDPRRQGLGLQPGLRLTGLVLVGLRPMARQAAAGGRLLARPLGYA